MFCGYFDNTSKMSVNTDKTFIGINKLFLHWFRFEFPIDLRK